MSRGRHMPQEVIDRRLKMARDGVPFAEIARREGVRTTSMYNFLTGRGVEPPNAKIQRQWAQLAAAGFTAKDAAAEMGRSVNAAYAQAAKHGFRWAKDHDSPSTHHHVDNSPIVTATVTPKFPRTDAAKIAKARRMLEAGHPPGVISLYTGLTRGDVVMRLRL